MNHKTISLDDIKMLINNFEKLNPISLNIPKDEAAIQIFLELSDKKDINESLKLKEIITNILTNKNLLNSKFKDFYFTLIQYYFNPHEQIELILNKVKNYIKTNSNNEEEDLINQIDWVINTISSQDIFDFQIKKEYLNLDLSISNLNSNEYTNFIKYFYNLNLKEQKLYEINTFNNLRTKKHFSGINLKLPKDNNLITHYLSLMHSINDINFNIFNFKLELNLSNENLLYTISNHIFDTFSLFDDEIVNKEKFKPFTQAISSNYLNNPYHNAIHATDVLQTCFIILSKGNVIDNNIFDNMDICSMFITCLMHDIKHPGTSNFYQINKQTNLALRYNDKSPLENMHCSEGFKILFKDEFNILDLLKKEEIKIIRKKIIEAILMTDGINHNKLYELIKEKTEKLNIQNIKENDEVTLLEKYSEKYFNSGNDVEIFDNKQNLINYIIHTSDISNPGKIFEIYSKWTEFITTEFFNEGDMEKKENLPINFLCDRETTSIPKSQINFINFVVLPNFKLLVKLIPECDKYVENSESNIKKWENILKEEENKKPQNL